MVRAHLCRRHSSGVLATRTPCCNVEADSRCDGACSSLPPALEWRVLAARTTRLHLQVVVSPLQRKPP